MSLLDFSPRIPLGTFSILLQACLKSFQILKSYLWDILLDLSNGILASHGIWVLEDWLKYPDLRQCSNGTSAWTKYILSSSELSCPSFPWISQVEYNLVLISHIYYLSSLNTIWYDLPGCMMISCFQLWILKHNFWLQLFSDANRLRQSNNRLQKEGELIWKTLGDIMQKVSLKNVAESHYRTKVNCDNICLLMLAV